MESSPEGDEIYYCQGGEKQGSNPFPAPGQSEDEQEQASRDEVNQEGKERVPKTVIFLKHVEGKDADEAGKEDANDPRGPEGETFCRCFHNLVLMHG